MGKFVSYEKQSKKQRQEQDRKKRETWGNVKPVTRKIESGKVYRRRKARREEESSDAGPF